MARTEIQDVNIIIDRAHRLGDKVTAQIRAIRDAHKDHAPYDDMIPSVPTPIAQAVPDAVCADCPTVVYRIPNPVTGGSADLCRDCVNVLKLESFANTGHGEIVNDRDPVCYACRFMADDYGIYRMAQHTTIELRELRRQLALHWWDYDEDTDELTPLTKEEIIARNLPPPPDVAFDWSAA